MDDGEGPTTPTNAAPDRAPERPRVLLVEDDAEFSWITEANLTASGYEVLTAPSMHEALLLIESAELIDVILLDLGLPDIDGLAGIHTINQYDNLPIVVLTGDDRQITRDNAGKVGAVAYLVKTDASPDVLDRTVREAIEHAKLGRPPSTGARAYDGPEDRIRALLELLGTVTGLPRWAFVRRIGRTDLVLVRSGAGDDLLPGLPVTWDEAVLEAAAAGIFFESPTRLLSTVDGPFAPPTAALHVGSGDDDHHGVLLGWAPRPVTPAPALGQAMEHAIREIVTDHVLELERSRATRRADIAGNAAAVDSLTGLSNRRAFDAQLRSEESRCERHGQPACVFVVDLDQLKHVNDSEGHAAGDRYLRVAADALTTAIRQGDAVFRVGGDEFAVIAPRCDSAVAPVVAERIGELLAAHDVEASIGWAARPPEPSLLEAADAADRMMYQEKSVRRATRPESPDPTP